MPKVLARCHGGQTCSMHPGWMGLEHLKGGGGWEGVGRGGKGGIGGGKVGASWRGRRKWAGEGGVDSLGRVADETAVLIHGS